MLAAQTELKNAQTVKEFLTKHQLFHPNYFPVKEFNYIYFPLLKKAKIPLAKTVDVHFTFEKKEKSISVEDLLQEKLSKTELEILPKSQEIVGKILILEIPEELHAKARVIAKAYLHANKQIETVVRKEEIHAGDYRLRKVRVLAGKNTKETVHHENGISLLLDLEKTYFSARSSNERLRIAKQVRKGEEILVMFSGAAPYPLVIAKQGKAKSIYGVEMNPLAHQYALKNIAMNHFEKKIIIYEGNVYTILPKIKKKFDRIVMPLPKSGHDFLNIALTKAKKGTIVHFYAFAREEEIPAAAKEIKELCKRCKHRVKILRAIKCGQYSPHTFRICFDLKVEK